MTVDPTSVIDAYMAAWNEPDAARRLRLLETCWAEDGIYTDPGIHLIGRAALSARIGMKQAERPGAKLVLLSAVDHHHGLLRFHWRLIAADGTPGPKSIDIGELGADGARLIRMIGFFGPPRGDQN